MKNNKSCIYYTDNVIREPICSVVREKIKEANLPIISVSLKPIDFGKNIVLDLKRGYVTMVKQILTALENVETKYVFFTEHDVLYDKSHFNFTPEKDDVFYYNHNVWRWYLGDKHAIKYNRMLPLSSLCCNTALVLANYQLKWLKINEYGLDKFNGREPKLARIWGYEPGTKKKRRGGLTNHDFETWQSDYPIIDIRHKGTFSQPKNTLNSFKHKPTGWEETSIDDIKCWDLRSLNKKI